MNAAVDAAVCLLLISGAVVGLVGVDGGQSASPGRADAVAETLATTTAAVNYSLAPGVRSLDGSPADGAAADGEITPAVRPDSPKLDRTAHGSLAGLLARAATTNSGVGADASAGSNASIPPSEPTPLTRTMIGFRRAVADAVRARTGAGVRAEAIWRPYPGAPVGGIASVGPEPPADGVHAATLSIPTRAEPVPPSSAADFETLGAETATRAVAVLVPPGAARVTLRSDDPAAVLVRHRYDRLSASTNASVSGALATEDTDAANDRVADALASRMAADLRTRYETPAAARDSISVSSVRIVIRTWGAAGEER